MIIVSPEVLQRVQNTQNASVSVNKMPGDTVSELDREMFRLLNNKNISDHDKWDQYHQVLQRYLHYTSQKRKPVQIPIVELKDESEKPTMSDAQSSIGHEDIVDTFSKNYKKDVRNILKAIDGKKDLISWDNDGIVYIQGDKIPHSNIIDLLHDVIRVRKSTQPPGWEQLMHVLKKINIPNEFVTNPFSREYLLRIKGSNSGSTSDSDKEGAASVSRRRLNFSTPSKQSSRLDDTFPFGVTSVKTEPIPSKRGRKTVGAASSSAWEKFNF